MNINRLIKKTVESLKNIKSESITSEYPSEEIVEVDKNAQEEAQNLDNSTSQKSVPELESSHEDTYEAVENYEDLYNEFDSKEMNEILDILAKADLFDQTQSFFEKLPQDDHLGQGSKENEFQTMEELPIDHLAEKKLLKFYAEVDRFTFIELENKNHKGVSCKLDKLFDISTDFDVVQLERVVLFNEETEKIEPLEEYTPFFSEGFTPEYAIKFRSRGKPKYGIDRIVLNTIPVNKKEVLASILQSINKNTFKNSNKPDAALIQLEYNPYKGTFNLFVSPILYLLFRKSDAESEFIEYINRKLKESCEKDFQTKVNIEIINDDRIPGEQKVKKELSSFLVIAKNIVSKAEIIGKIVFSLIDDKYKYLFRFIDSFRYTSLQFNGFPNKPPVFYYKDILDILGRLEEGIVGDALLDYLNVSLWRQKNHYRINLLKQKNMPEVEKILSKALLVQWPSKYNLAAMQELAVKIALTNIFSNEPTNGSITSVHGPPGVGKTTMTNELIANILLNKVNYLSESFAPQKVSLGNGEYFYFFGWELRKFSILIASSNNNAVKNITETLPKDQRAIEIGCRYFGFSPSKGIWGMISGTLGRAQNIREYFDNLSQFISTQSIWVPLDKKVTSQDYHDQYLENLSKTKYSHRNPEIDSLTDRDWQLGIKSMYSYSSDFEGDNCLTSNDKESLFKKMMNQNMLVLKKFEKEISQNLKYARLFYTERVKFNEMFKNISADNKKGFIQSILDTLFLLTPIISTAFASSEKMFEGLGLDAYGTLIVDEASMAKSYEIVKTLYHATHLVTLGDEEQLPPIVDDKKQIYSFLRRKYIGNDRRFDRVRADSTIQEFSTRASKYVGYQKGNRMFVGVPLRVHRRCSEPQFSIANEISYGNSMIQGKLSNPFQYITPQWIDIPPSEEFEFPNKSHSIPEQCERAVELAITYHYKAAEKEGKIPDIAILSPFKSVVNGVFREIKSSLMPEDIDLHVGTVSSSQGREYEFVIMVMGGNPKNKAAINFAARKPNLLNVSCTRAKQAS